MQKYDFIKTQQGTKLTIQYGDLGSCQLMYNIESRQLCVLKLAPIGQALKDIKLLTGFRHKNIVRIYEYFPYDDSIAIVFEYLGNGNLQQRLLCKKMRKKEIIIIFKCICLAVKQVHQKNVVIKNLKSQNVLFDQKMNVKIVDFGLALRINQQKFQNFCYISIEMLLNRQFDVKSDIWSLGVILYEILFQKVPFKGKSVGQVLKQIEDSDIFNRDYEKGSPEQLIQRMLSVQPSKRPSIGQILKHPYLKLADQIYQRDESNIKRSLKQKTDLRQFDYRNKNKRIQRQNREVIQIKQKTWRQFISDKIDAIFDCENVSRNGGCNFTQKI